MLLVRLLVVMAMQLVLKALRIKTYRLEETWQRHRLLLRRQQQI